VEHASRPRVARLRSLPVVIVNTYQITRDGLTLDIRANNPADAIEFATILHNLPRFGITAQRKDHS
jgi:hypothetical protein